MAAELRVKVEDVPFGGMRVVEDGDSKALFVRDGDGVRAFQAKCPHYGAPLAKGVICGSTLYCPWHKAAFDIGSGDLREPPALDDLQRFPVRTEDGWAIATLQPMERAAPPNTGEDKHVVIVGTGAAAVAAATTLRRSGFAGRIAMVGREDAPPYDRPKLSKNFLAKPTPGKTMWLEDDFYAELDVKAVSGPAKRIEPATRTVTLANGETIIGDALFVATGSRAAKPAIPGADLARVFTLRSLADAEAVSTAAEKGGKIVVIGAGFIGTEAAAFLTKRGLEATIVTPEAVPFAKRFGEAVGRALKAYHQGNGIRFVEGKVDRIAGTDGVANSVHLQDGSVISADLVLVGAGAEPETGAIEAATRDDGGIRVGADMSVAPDVWIGGDIAAFPERRAGTEARIEHWRLAEQHGIYAARAIMGRDGEGFGAAPFFWSNQGDKRLDYAGYAPDWDELVVRGDVDGLDFITYYVKDGRALAACSIGRNTEMIEFLHHLDSGAAPAASELAPA